MDSAVALSLSCPRPGASSARGPTTVQASRPMEGSPGPTTCQAGAISRPLSSTLPARCSWEPASEGWPSAPTTDQAGPTTGRIHIPDSPATTSTTCSRSAPGSTSGLPADSESRWTEEPPGPPEPQAMGFPATALWGCTRVAHRSMRQPIQDWPSLLTAAPPGPATRRPADSGATPSRT